MESRSTRLVDVIGSSECSQVDRSVFGSQEPSNLEAIHVRKQDIQYDDLRLELLGDLESIAPIARDPAVMSDD